MSSTETKFSPGELVKHRLFDYRGVIVDVDPVFQESEQWYAEMAKTKPPKDEPWYHVLVHEATHVTYVAERNLESDQSSDPIEHPMIEQFFKSLDDGKYVIIERIN